MVTLHVGTYAEAGGPGLVPLAVAPDGTMEQGSPFAGAANASFAIHSPRHDLHFLTDEQEQGAVTVLRCERGAWRRLARVETGGAAPCFLALDADENRLAAANYESGTAALFALDDVGLPQAPALFQSSGRGPVAERQEGPHAHCVQFSRDGSGLYLVDLGADRVLRLDLDGAAFGEAGTAWQAPAGEGPRHLQFQPNAPLAIVLSELASRLTLFGIADDRWHPRRVRSTLPYGFAGESLGGHLALNLAGDRVYVSNRGHDSIAVFALDAAAGELALLQHVATGGEHPRHFVLLEDERLLVAAHEKDGRIAAFRIGGDGTLAPLGDGTRVPGACFLLREDRVRDS